MSIWLTGMPCFPSREGGCVCSLQPLLWAAVLCEWWDAAMHFRTGAGLDNPSLGFCSRTYFYLFTCYNEGVRWVDQTSATILVSLILQPCLKYLNSLFKLGVVTFCLALCSFASLSPECETTKKKEITRCSRWYLIRLWISVSITAVSMVQTRPVMVETFSFTRLQRVCRFLRNSWGASVPSFSSLKAATSYKQSSCPS